MSSRPKSNRDGNTLRKHSPKKVLIVGAGGGFQIQIVNLLKHCPPDVVPVVVGYGKDNEKVRHAMNGRTITFRTLRFFRSQQRERPAWRSLPDLLLGTVSALEIVWRERPDAIVGVGQRAAVYFLIAARIFRIPGTFVECITRVTKPSSTGSIIAKCRLAKHLYVQWPDLVPSLSGSIHKGQML